MAPRVVAASAPRRIQRRRLRQIQDVGQTFHDRFLGVAAVRRGGRRLDGCARRGVRGFTKKSAGRAKEPLSWIGRVVRGFRPPGNTHLMDAPQNTTAGRLPTPEQVFRDYAPRVYNL